MAAFEIINGYQNDAPNDTAVSETINGKNDGRIIGVDSTMDYRKDGASTYTAISGTEVTGLADGIYYVRYAAKTYYNPSTDKQVTIAAGRMLTVTVSQNQVGYLSDENAVYYNTIFNEKLQNLIANDETGTEYRETKKAIERTKTAIATQVRNMREAGYSLRIFIEDDITEMTKDLDRLERELARIQESKVGNALMLQELNEVRKKLLSFADYAKDAQPEELVNLISTVVERIYITTENGKRICHIFMKGCTKEDYTDLFGAADYITDINNPLIFNMCDSEHCRENYVIFAIPFRAC